LKGFESNAVDLTKRSTFDGPDLPPFVLRRPRAESTTAPDLNAPVPKSARKDWERAVRAAQASKWNDAERPLRAILKANPGLAPAWHLLGSVCQSGNKPDEARDAYRRAIESDPAGLGPRVLLARLDIDRKDWTAALESSAALIQADPRRLYPEAHLHNALARYQLKDYPGAEAAALQASKLDRNHLLSRAEYLLGLILAARHDFTGAATHFGQYLVQEPNATDAALVRAWIAKLKSTEAQAGFVPESAAVNWTLPPAGEVAVPGGMKALAAAARVEGPVNAGNFFAEYCRALVRGASSGPEDSIARYSARLLAYFQATEELAGAGAAQGNRAVITLSLASAEHRQFTARILPLLGWKVVASGETTSVEPGDREPDGARQPLAAEFGIDEIAMQEALQAGRGYSFSLPVEAARLIGGDAWAKLIRKDQSLPGGLAESFARDRRLAKVYAALSAMGTETATTLVAAVGLRPLIERHAGLLGTHPLLFRLENGAVRVPGGGPAEDVWTKLAGASPREPKAFMAALLNKDEGRLAAYYAALSEASPAAQRFFTADAARAGQFASRLRWSNPAARVPAKHPGTWLPGAFGELPVSPAGAVAFPGGRQAWTSGAGADGEILLRLDSPDVLLALSSLEKKR
ncbi:MAG: hypothetical protein NTY38_16435, partial [Acidobacteria bacterium]|nr:hypothetical protein [Acidobacteriota bacterium]